MSYLPSQNPYGALSELERATTTIKNALEIALKNPRIIVNDICRPAPSSGHSRCAAVDINSSTLPDPHGAIEWLNTLGLDCEPHLNGTATVVAIGTVGSHIHCEEAPLDEAYTLPNNYEEWKISLAEEIKVKALAWNIEPRYAIAAAVLESGLNPDAVGDWNGERYCSFGLLQLNYCVHGKKLSTDEQIDLWLANFRTYYERSGSVEIAYTSWNSPAYARQGIWKTKYYYKYSKILNQISND